MRLRWLHRRPSIALGAAGVVALLALTLGSGPVVRYLLARAAGRRGVHVDFRSAWPCWPGVCLRDVELRLVEVPGVTAHVDDLRVEVSAGLAVTRLVVRGARVVVHGAPGTLRDELSAWSAGRGDVAAPDHSGKSHPQLDLGDASLLWFEREGEPPRLAVQGFWASRGPGGLAAHVAAIRAWLGRGSASLVDARIDADAGGSIARAHAASLAVEWTFPDRDAATPPLRAAEPPTAVDVATPFLALPELYVPQAMALELSAAFARRLQPGASLEVDAATWRVAWRTDAALSVGPGTLRIGHDAGATWIEFAAGATAEGPSLSARLAVPVVPGDSTLDLQGGPVSLAGLGAQDGKTGLFDVAHTTVSGRAHMAVSTDARSFTFDCAGSARGISLRDERVAADDIRGLDLQLRARGAATMPGSLRLDELALAVGALHVDASGVLDQESDHVEAVFRIAVPTTPCNTVLDSIPSALLPVASAMAFTGTFGATGRLAFDSRSLDDLDLEYDIRDACRASAVPPALSRDAFHHPFTHKVYLPDGTQQDEETGPGTPSWTPLDQISPFMEVALTTTEDGAFRSHHGFNRNAIRQSLIANLKARRFVRGASTLTMQLAKNLFLSRDKNVARKLEEVILTDYLEQALSKDEILELYLNVVEFGPAVYGVTAASDYYFGRTPAELDLAESLFLASILPAPIRFGSVRDGSALPESRLLVLRSLMRVARKRGLLSDQELADGLRESVEFWHGSDRPPQRTGIPVRSRSEGQAPGNRDLDEPDSP